MKIKKLLKPQIVSLLAFCLLTPVFASSSKAAELEEIMRRGQLIVAVKDNLRPLGFYDERGNLQGLEIDIARRLAKEILGSADAIVLKPVTNQERLQVILDNQVDIVIARIATTPSRDRLVDFSDYYYLDGTGIVTKNPTLQKLDDLATGKIAVLKNSSTIAVVRSELPNARLIGVDSYQEALTLLEAGQADAFAADNSVLTGWVQEYPQYRQLPVRLSGDALCIAIPKGLQYSSLHQKINTAIARWQKSGWLRERATYWGLP
ncbi:MAG: transporter substrate-binding domain-containing protein [Hydrococcus sp. Prado102]|jgi:polar amino acid transport system substrate-binding protein|nr:transporter substrate-binding domain-containing protein [Hydrococcus sp. Prado102]